MVKACQAVTGSALGHLAHGGRPIAPETAQLQDHLRSGDVELAVLDASHECSPLAWLEYQSWAVGVFTVTDGDTASGQRGDFNTIPAVRAEGAFPPSEFWL
jgi:hypothetical protein